MTSIRVAPHDPRGRRGPDDEQQRAQDPPSPDAGAGAVLALQRTAGNAAVAGMIARQAVDEETAAAPPRPAAADPHRDLPEWSITSSLDALPGDPVPGYELGRPAYTESDRAAFTQALYNREQANVDNVGAFLSEYAGGFLELWGTHVSEAMAKAADDSGFSFGAKLFKFIVAESLQGIVAVMTGGQSLLWGKALSFIAKRAVGFVADLAGDAIEGEVREGQVGEEQSRMDRLSAEFADRLRGMVGETVRVLGGIAPYGTWLGTVPVEDLGRFRVPPLFPPIPAQTIRASVAAAIVGGLQEGEQFVFRDDEHVIRWHLTPGPGRFVAVHDPPTMRAPAKLAQEMLGQDIAALRGMPLFITLASDGPDTDRLVAGPEAGTGLPFRIDEGGLAVPADEPAVDLPALVKAYPFTAPTEITRTADGAVRHLGGGLVEHLYLAKRIQPDLSLAAIIDAIREAAYGRELQEAEEGTGTSSQALTPEDIALGIFRELYPLVWQGAEDLITTTVERTPISEMATGTH